MPTIRDGLEMALEHHRAGRLQQAESIYRQLISAAPMQPDPHHLLGVIATQVGRHDLALDFIQQAIKLNPFAAVFHNTLGVAYEGLGRLDESTASFEQAISIKGDYAEGYFNLARLQDRRGLREKAIASCRTALRINPHYLEGLCLLGQYEAQAGRIDEAADLFRQALRMAPDHIGALQGLGMIRFHQQRWSEAADRLLRIVELTPQRNDVYYTLGIALQQSGRLDDAERAHRQALTTQPNSAEIHNNLGICLALRGRLEEAIGEFRETIRLEPNHSEAHSNLGNVLLTQGKYSESVVCYRESLKHNDQNSLAYNNISAALAPMGMLHEAAQCGELAIKLQPEYPDAYNNLGNIYKDLGWFDQSYAASREAMRQRPGFSSAHSNLVMTFNYDPRYTPDQIAAEHWLWYEQQAAAVPQVTSYRNTPDPERPIRIGYVSPDFRSHPVADFVRPMVEHHNRARYPTILYSNSGATDSITRRIENMADGWRNIHGRTDEEVAAQVQADDIDILIDLTGHTAHHRLMAFASRPAPVQITYLGYPAGTGLPAIDYLITDAIVDHPNEDSYYVEKLVRIDGCFSCWSPPVNQLEVNDLPAARNGYVTFGSLHAIVKLNPVVIALWSRLLNSVPNSKLLLARTTLRGPGREQIVNEFLRHGVDPGRIEIRHEWPNPPGHWGVYHDIDISLDVFPWCGHTTACESLWMGVPIVTLSGNCHAGRMVASVLNATGLRDWIAHSQDEYVQIASAQAADIANLAELRRGLRQQIATSELCDGRRFMDRFEIMLRQMWRTWCASQK